ncbi:TPA: type 1 fimbrial protein [Klebsiella pneumoniae]|nr:type 1 fimbrial protein [Klebsiella pneumoniae]
MKKNVVAAAMAMALVSFGVNAADQGQGIVKFKGTVIDAPCSIAQGSEDQSINFGSISKSHLNADGISQKKDLDIMLINCEPNKSVEVTFTGQTIAGATTELGTAGDTGTAVMISGQDGKFVEFGTKGGAQALKAGDNTLHYSTWVKKATNGTVKEGAFTAVANFNLTYN